MKCQYLLTLFILPTLLIAQLHIAIVDLEAQGGITASESQVLTSKLSTELVKSDSVTVVERNEMNTILKEQGFQQTGCTSNECAVEIGQLLGVSHMVTGSIGKIDDNYYLNLRRINVESGKIERSADQLVEGSLSRVLTDAIPELVHAIIDSSYNPQARSFQKNRSNWGEELGKNIDNFVDSTVNIVTEKTTPAIRSSFQTDRKSSQQEKDFWEDNNSPRDTQYNPDNFRPDPYRRENLLLDSPYLLDKGGYLSTDVIVSIGGVRTNRDGAITNTYGVNLFLGFSGKSYWNPVETNRFNPYWSYGSILLIVPYVGVGMDYVFDSGFYVGVGTFYIIPEVHIGFLF